VQRQDVENLAKVNWSVGRRKGDLEYRTHENSSMKARRSGFGWDDFSMFVVLFARMPKARRARQLCGLIEINRGPGGMGLDFVEVRRNCLRSINARRGHWPEGECRLARATDAGAA
jgi:hypothetical protein